MIISACYQLGITYFLVYCFDFRNESNGIFELGVGFLFLQTNFDFLISLILRDFFYHSKRIVVLSLNLKKKLFFVKLWGFGD